MIGTTRNLDRRFLRGEVNAMTTLEPDYRAFLRRGAGAIATDVPLEVGSLLYGSAAVPASREKYLRAR